MGSDDSMPIYGWVAGEGASQPVSPGLAAWNGSGAVGSRQLLEGLLVALVPSSLGLVAYAILREAYVWFYQRYTVAPEEVGLNQLRMLSSMFRFVHLWVWTVPGSPLTNMLVLLQQGRMVHPAELAFLLIEADPAQ